MVEAEQDTGKPTQLASSSDPQLELFPGSPISETSKRLLEEAIQDVLLEVQPKETSGLLQLTSHEPVPAENPHPEIPLNYQKMGFDTVITHPTGVYAMPSRGLFLTPEVEDALLETEATIIADTNTSRRWLLYDREERPNSRNPNEREHGRLKCCWDAKPTPFDVKQTQNKGPPITLTPLGPIQTFLTILGREDHISLASMKDLFAYMAQQDKKPETTTFINSLYFIGSTKYAKPPKNIDDISKAQTLWLFNDVFGAHSAEVQTTRMPYYRKAIELTDSKDQIITPVPYGELTTHDLTSRGYIRSWDPEHYVPISIDSSDAGWRTSIPGEEDFDTMAQVIERGLNRKGFPYEGLFFRVYDPISNGQNHLHYVGPMPQVTRSFPSLGLIATLLLETTIPLEPDKRPV
jgi:hypothetical protein